MAEETVTTDRFAWRPSLYTAIGTSVVFFLLVMWNADADVLYLLGVIPIASLVLLILIATTKGSSRLSTLSMLAVFGTLSWILMHHSFEVRATGRWLIWSKSYEAQVLAQPYPNKGELRHIEWDGWGFVPAGDTNVYLVFDPTESLSQEIKRHSSGKFVGIPREIWKLHRLESHWFYAVFYTDTEWE